MQFSRVALAEDGFGANTTTTIHPLPRSPAGHPLLFPSFLPSCIVQLLAVFRRLISPSPSSPLLLLATLRSLRCDPHFHLFGKRAVRLDRPTVRRSLVRWSERSGFNAASGGGGERCRSSGAGK